MIPFTVEQFFDVFATYNETVFPSQILLTGLAAAAIFFAAKPNKFSGKIITVILGFLWIWAGVVYHLLFFAQINKAAYIFGAIFVLQGLFFLKSVAAGEGLSFSLRWNTGGIVGGLIIVYALFIYPALGFVFGRLYPETPTFGAPCPTTIFTLGLLLWAERKVPIRLFIIPLFWSLVGFSAAFSLGVWEDYGLLASGIAVGAALIIKEKPLARKPSVYFASNRL